jgi:hypothetical protein
LLEVQVDLREKPSPIIPKDTYLEMCKFFSKIAHPRILADVQKQNERSG